jgi:lipopolysaccharide transport system permease protein
VHHQATIISDKPLVTIKPSRSWVALDLRDLWLHRELLYFLIWRDVKVRYKQTLLGVLWVVIQPLLTTLIFTLFFGILAGVPSEGMPYPVFVFAGLLPWMFFSNAVTQSSNSLVGSSNLITKVYFPRLIIPCAAVGAGLVDFLIAFLVLLGLMLYYGVAVTASILMLLPLVLLLTVFALSIGLWLSALNVKYRDVRHATPFILQMWMFASPVIYPPTLVPVRWRWMLIMNPMTGIIDGFRSAILGQKSFDWNELSVAVGITLVLLIYSAYSFKRMEKTFADLI